MQINSLKYILIPQHSMDLQLKPFITYHYFNSFNKYLQKLNLIDLWTVSFLPPKLNQLLNVTYDYDYLP